MPKVKLTSKRQATFPQAVCESLGIGPGDEVELESRVVDGETVWILRPHNVDWTWFGSVKPRRDGADDSGGVDASGEDGGEDVTDDIDAIRRSAARGWGREAGKR